MMLELIGEVVSVATFLVAVVLFLFWNSMV